MNFFPPFPYGFIVDAFWTFMSFPLSFDALLLKWKILKYIATLYCIENVSYAEEEGEWLMYCFRWQKCWCWREKCRKEGRGEVRRHRGTGAEVGDICLCLGGTKLPTWGSRKKPGIVSYRSSPDLILCHYHMQRHVLIISISGFAETYFLRDIVIKIVFLTAFLTIYSQLYSRSQNISLFPEVCLNLIINKLCLGSGFTQSLAEVSILLER